MNNIGYLFAANMIVWVALFSYIYSLVQKNGRLYREIESLKKSLSSADK